MTKKYEKFEEWMVGRAVKDPNGDVGVVTREYEGVGSWVWVEWEDQWMGEAWIAVENLTFLNNPRCDTQSQFNDTPIPWEVGQIVWDVVFGKGVVRRVEEGAILPVKVGFDDGDNESYTLQGHFYEVGTRTLFFSEPTIIADTIPPKKPFVPTLKEGDVIAIFHPFSENWEIVTVLREEQNLLYFKHVSGQKDYSTKQHISAKLLGEEIKWEN